MVSLEEAMNDLKKSMESIKAPSYMEDQLRSALNQVTKPKPEGKSRLVKGIAVAAAFLLVIFFAYSFDALAYYGKYLLGYDEVISGGLRELNLVGKGQDLGKSYTFSDGTSIFIDKIFFDKNKLIVLFTERATKERPITDKGYNRATVELKGIFGSYFSQGGYGFADEDKNQISCSQSFNPPKALEKWMSFIVSKNVGNKIETAQIRFVLDRDKAIMNTISQDINQSIIVDGKEISFDNITVSAMSTVINGTAVSLGQDEHITFDLVVNGQEIHYLGTAQSNGHIGWEFDGISDVNSLKLSGIKLIKKRIVDINIPLNTGTKDLIIGEGDELFVIKEVFKNNGNTCLKIKRNSNVDAIIGVFNENNQLNYLTGSDKLEESIDSEVKVVEEIREYAGMGNDMTVWVKAINVYTPHKEDIDLPIE